jgi:simple sugar transport system ATP-binding protein
MNLTALLSVRDIHKWFGKVHALDGISVNIFPGEVVGLLGDNGAGKSTLIKIIAGLIRKDKGEIYWEGKKVEINSIEDSRRLGIETVFQERGLVENFTVSKNLFLGREPVKNNFLIKVIDYKKMNKETFRLMKDMHLRVRPDQEVRFCSGGEKQGVIVARAMYFKAKLVILDEPTRALSIKGVEQVLEFVKKLKEQGIACIFVTHNVYHVYPIADRFVFLHAGRKKLEVQKKEVSSAQELEGLLLKSIIAG